MSKTELIRRLAEKIASDKKLRTSCCHGFL
jgi:hypothetical protein